jgi:malate dehydrogenase (oxaloacetate-decarboxylating)(NADP+)
VLDVVGVVYEGRTEDMDPYKGRYAVATKARTLVDAIPGADIFLGLSAPGVLKAEMVEKMAARPIIMALANPEPEILPEVVKSVRDDAVIATGRSDYPNQVNNVLCFPFIFRGALDVGASTINEEMKLACVYAIANLANAEASDVVARAYGGQSLSFGPEYLISKPFDPRLIVEIAPAVAKAVMDSGVATLPIEDFDAYRAHLIQFVYRSGLVMKPVFDRARETPQRLVYAEGENLDVLRAVQIVIDDGLAKPILIGRRAVIQSRLEKLGMRFHLDQDVELVDPESDPRFREYWKEYHEIMQRRGITPDSAKNIVRTRSSVLGALMVRREDADALICGTVGRYERQLTNLSDVLGYEHESKRCYAVELLILSTGTIFITDTSVNFDPTAEEIAESAMLGAATVARFGIEPKVALISYSNFGSSNSSSSKKMRLAFDLIREQAPELEVEGEMHINAALLENIRKRVFPDSALKGAANLLVMPNLDAASAAFDIARTTGEGLSLGPIIVGLGGAAHIVHPSITVRGLVNMSAVAAVDALHRGATADAD